MDDREIIEQLKEIQARLASALSVMVLEIAQVRAFVQAILHTQGTIQVLQGRSQAVVEAELQQLLTRTFDEEKTRVEQQILAAFDRILTRSQ